MLSGLRFALRQLLKSPGFTLTAGASFALGIGLVATPFNPAEALRTE